MAFLCLVFDQLKNEDGDIYDQCIRYSAFVGRSIIAVAFSVVYVYAGELFPTDVRNSGLGVCSMSGRVGGMLAPQVMKFALHPFNLTWLPIAFFGFMALVAGFVRY